MYLKYIFYPKFSYPYHLEENGILVIEIQKVGCANATNFIY